MQIPLPFTVSLGAQRSYPAYPSTHAQIAQPLPLPWGLKPLGSARSGAERLPDSRLRFWIEHEVLRGVTPRMLVWWFSHLEGDVTIAGQRINRYRAWHPYDHVHASYARRLPDGSVGPGAAIRLREYMGANRAYLVNVTTDIEKLDETGFIHNPRVAGISGLVRMEYTFTATPEGTQYHNCLVIGGTAGWRRAINPALQALRFDSAHGMAWLRHNVEEVGQFERFLPELYFQETGLRA